MVGNGMGAKNGILFKTSEALESAGRTEIVALDKTGTITSGQPVVTDIYAADGVTEKELLDKAAALEGKSEHPLARAVMAKAEEDGLTVEEVEDFKAEVGSGLTATLHGHVLYGGNARYISTKCNIAKELLDKAEEYSSKGKTPLFFAQDDTILGMIAVADTIKPDSRQAITELRNMGVEVVMITGDNEKTAKAIGEEAGVDTVIAGVLPEGKEAKISELMKKGKTAMVGDGINDAPALTRADTGIAIGAGTDVAIDSADIVLMNSKLTDVSAAIRLSRAVLRNIHENLFWAFFYNLICIPLAAGLYGWKMSPMVGAAAMSLSSVTVCLNALRLNLFHMHDARHDHKMRKKKKAVETTEETKDTREILVQGMMCEHCENAVQKALLKIDGITDVKADHESGKVTFVFTKPIDEDEITAKIEEAGYKVVNEMKEDKNMTKTMKVTGMMCEHCEARVERALNAIDGVTSCKADHNANEVKVELSKDVDDAVLTKAVEDQDYKVEGIN